MNMAMQHIGRLLCLSLAAVMLSCSKQEAISDQRTAIETYLTGHYEYQSIDGAFRAIVDSLPDRSQQPLIANGDSVWLYLECYMFATAPGTLLYTNRQDLAERSFDGADFDYWSFEKIGLKVGSGDAIKGLERALPNCASGDSLYVWVTSDLSFDNRIIGTMSSNSALMYILSIEDVKKQ